jgi:hypothetical protein
MKNIILFGYLKTLFGFSMKYTTVSRLGLYSDEIYDKRRNTNPFGILSKYDSILNGTIISIRGSIDKNDWYDNLKCVHEEWGIYNLDGKIHKGYLKRIKEIIKSNVYETIVSQIKYSKKTIYLTGHSSGGVKSIILGKYLSHEFEDKTFVVVVFGIPSFCDEIFLKSLRQTKNLYVTSFRMDSDVIPYFGYGTKHTSLKLMDKRRIHEKLNLIEHHSMKTYIRQLDKLGDEDVYTKKLIPT